MTDISITWKDVDNRHRGFTIRAGQAHVGHLVGLIVSNRGTDIHISRLPPAMPWWEKAKEAGWTAPPDEETTT